MHILDLVGYSIWKSVIYKITDALFELIYIINGFSDSQKC